MGFAHDTVAALALAADLVNADDLTDVHPLEMFLDKHEVTPRPPVTAAAVAAVQALRPKLRALWQVSGAARPRELAESVNELLASSGARPYLTDHSGWGWHLHVTGPDAPMGDRLAAQAAFGMADLVRMRETDRMRTCEAPDCAAVFVDLSKNRSRRYCDTGNCGNRQHVAAYRQRRAAARP
jgi:predicted RNA-binding Zn ribbon-like protein